MCEYCLNIYIAYPCVFPCTCWLVLIFCLVNCFLYMNLFPDFHPGTSWFFLLKRCGGHFVTMSQVIFLIKLHISMFHNFWQFCVNYIIFVHKRFVWLSNSFEGFFWNTRVEFFCLSTFGWNVFLPTKYTFTSLFWWRMFVLWLFNNNCFIVLFLLNILLSVWRFGKWVSIRSKNDFPIHTVAILLYDQLNHMLFCWQFVVLFSWLPLLGEW